MKRLCPLAGMILAACTLASAGGPLIVTGPALGTEGLPITWDIAQGPIQYRVDGGSLSGLVDHTTSVNRVNAMFAAWQAVPTTAISFQNAGAILPTGAFTDTDVNTLQEFLAVASSCDSGLQSPVIFDAAGTILQALGEDEDIIGFTSPCGSPTAHFRSALIVMNGLFQDGVASNGEITSAQFDEAMTHEIGHLSGLDHSQINVDVLFHGCSTDDRAGLPLMFPFAQCPARTTMGLPIIAPDDAAWISYLYPNSSFATNYGFVEGQILFPDGVTPAQGVNVIVRRVNDPATPEDESRRMVYSTVSGFLFTSNPGQSLTGTNTGGSAFGARAADREGYYKIPVPPGQYTVEIESVNPLFTSGSSVGPLDPPVPMPGSSPANATVTVTAGQSSAASFTLLPPSFPRFDMFEDESLWIAPPAPYRRAEAIA